MDLLDRRVKKIEKILELSDVVTLDWKDFTDLDKAVLTVLNKVGRRGMSTTEIARELNLEAPKTSGRVLVWNSLKKIDRISKRLKGVPIVLTFKKKWSLNFDDYEFQFEIVGEESS